MRLMVAILFLFLILTLVGYPFEANLKIIRLKEVTRIQDTEGTFYFKNPSKVCVDSTGNVYILDSSRILQFNSKGNYIKNFLKKGEGPGEISWVSSFCVTGESVIVYNLHPQKIIRFDTRGEYVEEFRFNRQSFMIFVSSLGDVHYFLGQDVLHGQSNGYADVPHEFLGVSGKGIKMDTMFTIPLKKYLVGSGGARGSFDIAELHFVVIQKRYLILAHTERYGIKIYDLTTGKIVREFSREYRPIPIPSHLMEKFNGSKVILNGTVYKKPSIEYFNDIRCLLESRGNVWIVTSSVNEKKGVLTDVIDLEGKYIDRFYLQLGVHTDYYIPNWFVHHEFLYAIEQSSDYESCVVKYRIDYP